MDDYRKAASQRWKKLEAEFPHWYSFFTDGDQDDWTWIDQKVTPWFAKNATKADWHACSDPAGFVYTVMFKNESLYNKFHAECVVGSPSYASRQTKP